MSEENENEKDAESLRYAIFGSDDDEDEDENDKGTFEGFASAEDASTLFEASDSAASTAAEKTSKKKKKQQRDFPSNEIEEAWKRIENRKKKHRRQRDLTPEAGDQDEETIENKMKAALLNKMDEAFKADIQLLDENKPAINKLKLLTEVQRVFGRSDIPMDSHVIDVFARWLSPLGGDGRPLQLPNLDIRTVLLRVLLEWNFDVAQFDNDLKSSKIGGIIDFLRRHPKETEQNRIMAKKIVFRWSKEIMELDNPEVADRRMERRSYSSSDAASRERREEAGREETQAQGSSKGRVRQPEAPKFDYQIKPMSGSDARVTSNKGATDRSAIVQKLLRAKTTT